MYSLFSLTVTCELGELGHCSSVPRYTSQSDSSNLEQAHVLLREPAPTRPGSHDGVARVSLLELDGRRE